MLLGAAGIKAVHRTLMKLSPGVNSINVLQATFACADPKCAKKTDNLTVFLHCWDLDVNLCVEC